MPIGPSSCYSRCSSSDVFLGIGHEKLSTSSLYLKQLGSCGTPSSVCPAEFNESLNLPSAAILAPVESSKPECPPPSRPVEGSFDKGLYTRLGLATALLALKAYAVSQRYSNQGGSRSLCFSSLLAESTECSGPTEFKSECT